jgi:YesN/AraC family two-component response regulator
MLNGIVNTPSLIHHHISGQVQSHQHQLAEVRQLVNSLLFMSEQGIYSEEQLSNVIQSLRSVLFDLRGSEAHLDAERMSDSLNISGAQEAGMRYQIDPDKDKVRILIIEDEYAERFFVKDMLREKYEVLEAVNGAEGLSKAIELLPDVIISDVVMPGMNGVELCSRLKSDVKTSHIPVILLTARTASEQRLQGFEAGADAYINKPFNAVELTLRVRNLLDTLNNQRKKYALDIFQTPRQVTTNGMDEKFLHHIINYIEENIDDPNLDIAALANELNMSSSNLYRKIKSITGMSSIDFVINHKMKYAAHLLLAGTYSVKEVAYMIGFTDARYFSTRFKKYFHYTPTEYVEQTLESRSISLTSDQV